MNEAVDGMIVEARVRVQTWRETKREQGLCPKHGTRLAPLGHCFSCRPDVELRFPKTGDTLKACVYCASCGRCYHAGSTYHHISARKRRGIQPGPNNSLFNYDKRKDGDPDKVLSLCGGCRKEDGRDDWKRGKYRNYVTWSGHCRTHAMYARRRSGDVEHPSKAIVHRSERVLEFGWRQRPIKVKFTCANRENGPHKSETYLSSTEHSNGKPRLEWRGLCPEHLRLAGDPNKITKDEIVGNEAHWVKLLFSQEDEQGLVPIFYSVCKETKLAPRQTALAYRHAGRAGGVCIEHKNNHAALAERLEGLARQSEPGNGQKNGSVDKKSARAAQKLLDVVNAIIAVWHDVRNTNLTRAEQIALVVQWRVAGKLKIGDENDTIAAANQVGERLRRLKVRSMVPDPSEPYRSLVKSVIDKAESGTDPNDIVSGLFKR